MNFEDLPPIVRASLHDAAREAQAAGGRLFVFGSFARGDARPNSDLDLGFIAPETGHRVRQLLANRIPQLPTVRAVELVDFNQLEPEFRVLAERDLFAPLTWLKILVQRNLAVHIYREPLAEALYRQLGKFLVGFKELLKNLQAKP